MDHFNDGDAVLPDIQALKGKLRELFRHASVSRLKCHTDCVEVQSRELDCGFRPGRILASNMVFILISGDAVRFTLKVHFNTRTARSLAFRIFGGKLPSDISEKQAFDYFKEYANLVAGSVVTLLGKIGIELGISLPLTTRGFYEVFSDYAEKQHPTITYSDFWELRVNGHELFCSVLIEVLDSRQLADLVDFEMADDAPDDDEELDFL